FRHERNLGIVLQAYLKDAEADARRLIAWARRRGTPVSVRLVKGAYWDYETAHAELEHWPVPVFETKPETDASFERLTRLFLEHESPEALLADPERIPVAPPPRDAHDFENEPYADFTRAAVRDDFAAALAAVRPRLGGDYPLVIDGQRVQTTERLVSVNPSRA